MSLIHFNGNLEYLCTSTKQIHCQEPFRINLLYTVKYIAILQEMLKIIVFIKLKIYPWSGIRKTGPALWNTLDGEVN